jgi:monoamine oxidase
MVDGEVVGADHVIVAVPAALYHTVAFDVPLPQIWRAFLAEVGPGRVEKLIVGFNARPWQSEIGSAGSLWAGANFAEAWDATAGQPERSNGALVFFSGGAGVDHLNANEVKELGRLSVAEAEAAIGGLAVACNGRIRRTNWSNDPFALGGYVNFKPGQLSHFAPLLWGPKPGPLAGRVGRVSFVGEHMSDAFPGYMNGAAETARFASHHIINAMRGLSA